MVHFLQVFHYLRKKRESINEVTVAGVYFYYFFISSLSGVSKNKGPTAENIWPSVYSFSSEHLMGVMWKNTERKKKNCKISFCH